MQEPRKTHWDAALRVLKYINGTIGQGLLLLYDNVLNMKSYYDSDWGGCRITRRSVSNYCIFLENLFLLGRWDLENCWSLLLLPSVGQVAGWWTGILLFLLLILRHSGLGRRVNTGWWGYLRRHSDAQVSKAGG